MKKRICLECGKTLKGRSDQKFCNDHCRSAYNNRKLREPNHTIRSINRILKKNRKILESLNPDGKITIPDYLLSKKGFDFLYHTHTFMNRKGQTCYFCYEEGYIKLDKNQYRLIRKKMYPEV